MPATVELAEVALPQIEVPRDLPVVPAATYRARLEHLQERVDRAGLDAIVVYGDREHFANLSYLTGFDPRYEEAIMVVRPGRTPVLAVGNENVAYAAITPYPIDIFRFSKFSLIGQPDPEHMDLAGLFARSGLADPAVRRVGVAGWKYWDDPAAAEWIDAPHYLVAGLAEIADTLVNAAGIFVEPGSGLRLQNDVHQIAAFEFAAAHGSQSMRRLIEGIRPGATELEVSALANPVLYPFNYHPTMQSGAERTGYGVSSPTSRRIEVGDPVSAGIGHWGSNTARAGFAVEREAQLPPGCRDYVTRLVAPYYETAAEWYETMRIGLTAGELYDVTYRRLADPFFGIFLNPGHFIHLDEWPSSPVVEGSRVAFESGQAVQLDIIPMTSTHHTSQIEDGIVLADAALRAELETLYPEVWARMQARRAMLADVFGVTLHDEVLPMSNTAGWLPPFWLAPNLAMRRG